MPRRLKRSEDREKRRFRYLSSTNKSLSDYVRIVYLITDDDIENVFKPDFFNEWREKIRCNNTKI